MVTPPLQRTLGLLPGSSIGEYDILGILESGPPGTLFHVRQRDTKESAELLLISRPSFPPNDDAAPALWRQSVRKWSDASASLQTLEAHPHIARLLTFGEVDAGFYLLMQATEGITLRQLLERKGARSPEWTLALCVQIASALDFASARGFAHGSLNPDSVVLERPTNDILLRYFGLYRLLPIPPTAYTAPEQAAGQEPNLGSDIYALGALLHTCLQGEPPSTSDAPESLSHAVASSPPIPLPDQPDWMQAIVAQAMQRDPQDRYRTAEDLITDFRLQRIPAPLLSEASVFPPGAEEQVEHAPIVETPESAVQNKQASDKPPGELGLFARFFAGKRSQTPAALPPETAYQPALQSSPEQTTVSVSAKPPVAKLPARRRTARASRSATEARRLNRVLLLTLLFVLLPLCILALHSLWLVDAYHSLYVMDRHFLSTSRVGGETVRLAIGDTVRGQGQPVLTTEKGSNLTLRLADSTLRLASDSQVQVRQLAFVNGRVRSLELLRGQINIDVQPQTDLPGQYAVLCHGVRVAMAAGRYQVTARTSGVEVRVLAGEATVTSGASKQIVEVGQELSARKGQTLARPVALSTRDRKLLAPLFPAVEAQTTLTHVQDNYLHAQQKTLMPIAARVYSFVQHTL